MTTGIRSGGARGSGGNPSALTTHGTLRVSPRTARRAAWRAIASVAGTLALSAGAFGQSQHSWTFAGSDLWTNAANWLGGTPDGNDDVYLSAGGGSFEISSIPSYSGWRLTSQAGAGSYTLGGGTMTFFDFGNTVGTGPRIENLSSNLLTISNAVVLDSDADSGSAGEINPVNGDMTFGGTVDLADSGNTQLRIFGNNGRTVTFNGIVSGPNSVAINQASNVVYNAANTYTGETFVNAGTLQFGAGGSVASAFIRLGDTTGSAPATLSLVNATGGQTISTPINVRAGSAGVKTIRSTNSSGTNTFSGNIFLDADVTVSSDNAGGVLALTGGTIDLKNRTMTVSGSGNTVISGNVLNPIGTETGTVTKTGTGVLTLSGANTYRGPTLINGGTVTVSADNNLGTAPGTAGTSAAASNVRFSGGALRPTSSFTLATTRTLGFLTGSGTIDVPTGVTLTVNGRLEGTTGYNKTGAGTLQLTNLSSAVTGAVSVTGGVLELSTSGRIGGTGVGAGAVTLDGATLRNNDTTTGNSLLTANRNLLIGAGGATFDTPTSGVALIYSGTMLGAGNTVTKIGAGEMRVQGANLPSFTFAKLVVLNGLYRIGNATGSSEVGFGAVPAGTLSDAITLNGGSLGTSLSITLDSKRGLTLGANGGTVTVTGGSLAVPSKITDGASAGSLNLVGTSVSSLLTLSNASNEIAQGIMIRGGRLNITATGAGGTGNLSFDLGTNGGGLSNNAATLVEVNNPLITLGGTSGTPEIGASSGNTLQVNSKITGARPFQKTSSTGAGTLTLTSNTSDFTGNISLSSGQIAVTANNALGSTAGSVSVSASTSLVFRGNVNYTATEPVFIIGTGNGATSPGAINSPQDDNTFAGPVTMTGTSSINVGTGSNFTLTGTLATQSPAYTLTKSGAGRLVLQGDSSAFNPTSITVAGGTLSLTNTSGSATGTAPISLSSSAALSGTGTAAGAVTVNSGATVAPGSSIGVLTVGSVDFKPSSTFLIDLNFTDAGPSTADRLVTTDAAATVKLGDGVTPPALQFVATRVGAPFSEPYRFVLIAAAGTNQVAAGEQFAGKPEGVLLSEGFLKYTIYYRNNPWGVGDANDVVIEFSEVPEPGSAVAVMALAGAAALRRRRR